MKACEGYDAISAVYDLLNADIDYVKWADFVEAAFKRFSAAKPEIVLDLACGTGRMTLEMASRGYDMIGVDGSEDMLSRAYENMYERGLVSVLFLNQDMRCFELYGTVGATLCCLDSVNYLLSGYDLHSCFACVHNYLDPDGLFLFDVNTPYKFKHVYGDNAYVLENELELGDGEYAAVYCGWQNKYDEKSGNCDFYLSLFEELEDGAYRRSDEHQREHCFSLDELKGALKSSGFEFLGCYSDFDFTDVANDPEAHRWYIAARCKKN